MGRKENAELVIRAWEFLEQVGQVGLVLFGLTWAAKAVQFFLENYIVP